MKPYFFQFMTLLDKIRRFLEMFVRKEEIPLGDVRYFIQTPCGSYPATHFLITEYGLEFLYDDVLSVYFSQHQTMVHDFESGVTTEDFEAVMKEAEKRREEYKKNIIEKIKIQQQQFSKVGKVDDREYV